MATAPRRIPLMPIERALHTSSPGTVGGRAQASGSGKRLSSPLGTVVVPPASGVMIGNTNDTMVSDVVNWPGGGTPFSYTTPPVWMDTYNITSPGLYSFSLEINAVNSLPTTSGTVTFNLYSGLSYLPISASWYHEIGGASFYNRVPNKPLLVSVIALGTVDMDFDVSTYNFDVASDEDVDIRMWIQRLAGLPV